jgi:hypothetical protein
MLIGRYPQRSSNRVVLLTFFGRAFALENLLVSGGEYRAVLRRERLLVAGKIVSRVPAGGAFGRPGLG